MSTKHKIVLAIFLAVLAGALILAIVRPGAPLQQSVNDATSIATQFDGSVSDGTVKISFDTREFGLATTKDQVPVHSYIPACDEVFDYCIYDISKQYDGTNFEAAGITIVKRADFVTEKTCLETPPNGYDPKVAPTLKGSKDGYLWSKYLGIGDAAAGHYSTGSMYRLFVKPEKSQCYEFTTRIAQSRFENYPAGAIKEFTAQGAKDLQAALQGVIENISLVSGAKVLFQ